MQNHKIKRLIFLSKAFVWHLINDKYNDFWSLNPDVRISNRIEGYFCPLFRSILTSRIQIVFAYHSLRFLGGKPNWIQSALKPRICYKIPFLRKIYNPWWKSRREYGSQSNLELGNGLVFSRMWWIVLSINGMNTSRLFPLRDAFLCITCLISWRFCFHTMWWISLHYVTDFFELLVGFVDA